MLESTIYEEIRVFRNKSIDNAVMGEIRNIATENRIFTEIDINEAVIVEALKKQIAMKPIEDRFPRAICPSCCGSMWLKNVQEQIQNEEYSHCEHCGQKIDWSDT